MSLTEANWCPEAATMLHNGEKLTDKRKAELKALFLEGLIRFLDIYSQTEIGEGVQIDIMKVALFVNSPRFENEDLYSISSIDDVYELCEMLTLAGLPIWRFLRLSEYQSRIFESGYTEILVSAKMKAAEERPCYGCIWYRETETFLGLLRECQKPRTDANFERKETHNPDAIKKCKWLTTLDTIPDAVENIALSFRKREFLNAVEPAREKFKKSLLKDSFRIPKSLTDKETVTLDKEYDPIEDLGRAWNNERTFTERQIEIRKAMYIEGMIRFFEMYAKCELGTRYIADIKNIALYVDGLESSEISFVKSFEDVYADLEDKIVSGFEVKKYVKFDEG